MVSVKGYLYRVRCQGDGDYHVEIRTARAWSADCLIVEVPDPAEVRDPTLETAIVSVRERLEGLESRFFTGHASGSPVSMRRHRPAISRRSAYPTQR